MEETARTLSIRFLLMGLIVTLVGCSYNDAADPDDEPVDPGDWTETTHGSSAAPDYDTVFPQDFVSRVDFVLSETDWQDMLDDMTDRYGRFGSGRPQPGGFSDDNPIWAPCSVFHDGIEWYRVGVRFKGNSSLQSAWTSGILKLPFKLDFDQYEDENPELLDQRFYGFRQLSFSNGFQDESLIREKVTADIFRAAGVPAAQTAFYRVYVDHGDGPEYFGLYTLVEVVDDTVIEDQFAEDGGNLYKPDGTGASFAYGTFSEIDFEKKSNVLEGDWSDIEALFTALHASSRTTSPEDWREGLESALDVDAFLRWLAVNTVAQNWDTYGRMTHNYYLYADPATDRLTWIPWDNNEALQEGRTGGTLSLDFTGVGSNWPLIRYLYDDTEYRARYVAFVDEVIDGTFNAPTMVPIYEAAADLIAAYAVGAEGERSGYTFLSSESAFSAEISELVRHVSDRVNVASSFVASSQ